MTEEKPFDAEAYWIERHKKFQNDPRSVGNMARDLEWNQKAETAMVDLAGAVADEFPSNKHVLDIGCGYGRIAQVFCDRGFDYHGLDVSAVAIEAARSRAPGGRFDVIALRQFQAEKQYDLVIAAYILIHIVDDQEWRETIGKLFNAMPENGVIIVFDHTPAFYENPSPHVVNRPLAMYRELFHEFGFEIDETMGPYFAKKYNMDVTAPIFVGRRRDANASMYSNDQRAFIVQQAEEGTPVWEICRRAGVSEETFYTWRKSFAGLSPTQPNRVAALEEENARLKRLVAELSLDKQILKDALKRRL